MTRTLEQNEKLIAVMTKYSLTSEVVGDTVILRDKKNVVIGTIELDGTVTRKKVGQQVLMGALIRNELVSAMAE
jgi:hypothetical protein